MDSNKKRGKVGWCCYFNLAIELEGRCGMTSLLPFAYDRLMSLATAPPSLLHMPLRSCRMRLCTDVWSRRGTETQESRRCDRGGGAQSSLGVRLICPIPTAIRYNDHVVGVDGSHCYTHQVVASRLDALLAEIHIRERTRGDSTFLRLRGQQKL